MGSSLRLNPKACARYPNAVTTTSCRDVGIGRYNANSSAGIPTYLAQNQIPDKSPAEALANDGLTAARGLK